MTRIVRLILLTLLVFAPIGIAPSPALAAEPGVTTVRLAKGGGEITYSANAAGWARTGATCIVWELVYVDMGPNGRYINQTTVDSGRKCGTGSFSTATFTRFLPVGRDVAIMKSTANGPGGSDSDSKATALP